MDITFKAYGNDKRGKNNNNYVHDFRSACLVRFRSRGAGLAPDALVAVFTNDSKISSSPSVKFSSLFRTCIPEAGDRMLSARRLGQVMVVGLSMAFFIIVGLGLTGVPRICLMEKVIFFQLF